MTRTHFVRAAAQLWVVFATATWAAAPDSVNFQGRLQDSSANPVTVATNVSYRIYDGPGGGATLLWGPETHNVTPDAGGLYSVTLGSIVGFPANLFAGTPRYLGVSVAADPELAPRIQIVSVAYSLRVKTVDAATGGTISGSVAVTGDLSATGKATIGTGHTNTGAFAFVAGESNTASGPDASVSGGIGSTATGDASTVGGGFSNDATVTYATVGGGSNNTASGQESTVGGGQSNTAGGLESTVGGGRANSAAGDSSTIAGGARNSASGNSATVGGGHRNAATGGSATVAGGVDDTASFTNATVGGGARNKASGSGSTVSGGADNYAFNLVSTVGGGQSNKASGIGSVIPGGETDTASGDWATVGGGRKNIASGSHATISGGWSHIASGGYSSIGGGQNNTASNTGSTVGGGYNNIASAADAAVGGGRSNEANGFGSTSSGGIFNIAGGAYATISGGRSNDAPGDSSTVAGGAHNLANELAATVGGGAADTAMGPLCTVGGGAVNVAGTAVIAGATVGGGEFNRASGSVSTIAGGLRNTASGDRGAIGGGSDDTASGFASTVPGGSLNRAAGRFSLAAGRRAKAADGGSFVWADTTNADFSSTEPNQFLIRAEGGVGIGTNNVGSATLEVVDSTAGTIGHMMNLQRTSAPSTGNDLLQILSALTANDFQFIECTNGGDNEFAVDGNGDVHADGTYTTPAADFAELIKVSSGASSVEPGDVLVIDPHSLRAAVKSTQARSSLVAGIYSTRPGFLGSERDWDRPSQEGAVAASEGESSSYSLSDMAHQFDEIPLAVVGIVPCKVSAENGPIRPGDLLVTSSTPGHAMRDDAPQVGTVLGKALGSLSSGKGTVKVLVTMH